MERMKLNLQKRYIEKILAALKLILFEGLVIFLFSNCSAQKAPVFSGENAYKYLQKQCDFGPRNPGSEGYRQCRDYLIQTMRLFADDVSTQPFLLSFSNPTTSVSATNIIARFQPNKSDRIFLCAHWDTRPWADQEPDPKQHDTPIMGANDGASGVAVLLEIATLLHTQKPEIGVDIVLFDGEDEGSEGEERSWAKGSAVFAQQLGSQFHPRFGILLDMIGDADLTIYKESFSNQYAPDAVNLVWNRAANLGVTEFIPQVGYGVFDDHIPLLEAGIPCIDLIDFNYPYWHTLKDTPDKCSPQSLEKVGRVLTSLIYEPD